MDNSPAIYFSPQKTKNVFIHSFFFPPWSKRGFPYIIQKTKLNTLWVEYFPVSPAEGSMLCRQEHMPATQSDA